MLLALRKVLFSTALILLPLYSSVRCVVVSIESKFSYVPELTMENVYNELVRQEIRQPEIVMRQIIAETRWLECKQCSMKFNNLFGFLTKSGYMKFESWTQSVAYYKEWQDELYKGGDYYTFLNHIGYATAPNYIRLLKQIVLPDELT